ncbi:MAG: hypothetical protein KDC53_03930 [Saprospiraceae bacterium]|nr:hypothetical protein [Saprospiraceae bacterium]
MRTSTSPTSSLFLPGPDRQTLMDKGIVQLDQWLIDVMRIGLLQYDFSDETLFEISSRMVDAKLGGVARRIRKLSSLERADPNWVKQVLQILGDLYLMVSAFKNRRQLTLTMQISLFSLAGFNAKKTDILTLNAIEDFWLVCGIEHDAEENLKVRYTWLMGVKSKRTALLLDFAFGRSDFEFNYRFNQSYQGSLIYYPGAFPLRAILQDSVPIKKISSFPGAFDSMAKFLDIYATAISRNPWIVNFPACLKNVSLTKAGDQFLLRDQHDELMTVNNENSAIWPLFSWIAVDQFTVFGIWNSETITILSYEYRQFHYSL